MRTAVLLSLVFVAGCSKCGGDKNVVDASVDAGPPKLVERRSVDVRTALIQAYPEYRGTALLDTTARVVREIPGLTDANRDAAIKKLNYESVDGGWKLAQFQLTQPKPNTLEVEVSLNVEQVGQLYTVPVGLSSQQMAMYLPRELPVGKERFEMELNYSSSAEVCVQLIAQAIALLRSTQQWTMVRGPDLDAGVPPDSFVSEVKNDNGTSIVWERNHGRVHVVYTLTVVD